MNQPLRYSITSWDQLPGCISNTSRDLSLHIKDFIQDRRLQGKLIIVRHREFGELLVIPVNLQGDLLDSNLYTSMSDDAIIDSLAGFGFYIEYRPTLKLPVGQIDYLLTVDKLGYDKLRVLPVKHYDREGKVFIQTHLVAFKIEDNPQWLMNTYECFEGAYFQALKNGSAMSLDSTSNDFKWDWLTYVANIKDILNEVCDNESGWCNC